eukprot:5085395-Prymnesium_polylepis.1
MVGYAGMVGYIATRVPQDRLPMLDHKSTIMREISPPFGVRRSVAVAAAGDHRALDRGRHRGRVAHFGGVAAHVRVAESFHTDPARPLRVGL